MFRESRADDRIVVLGTGREDDPSIPQRQSGLLERGEVLTITAESDLVVFGDGIESDALHPTWGQRITLRQSPEHVHLLAA